MSESWRDHRYSFTPYPRGWFRATFSSELDPGDVRVLKILGRELVAFRSESGDAAIADAHCPHLGAHLGHGGKVMGESIRCPFHHWEFGTDGVPTRSRPIATPPRHTWRPPSSRT